MNKTNTISNQKDLEIARHKEFAVKYKAEREAMASRTLTQEDKVKAFSKVLNIGKVDVNGKNRASLFVKVETKWKKGLLVLSISGVEGPLPSGDCRGSCGQILDSLKGDIVLNKEWTKEMVDQLYDVWDSYHLNDMEATCEHQRESLNVKEKMDDGSYRLHKDHNEGGFLGLSCPVCGYRLGYGWLHQEIPAEVIDFLKGLPNSKDDPQWV